MSLELNKHFGEILQGVHPGWKAIIGENLRKELEDCLSELANYLLARKVTQENILTKGLNTYIKPHHHNILECFKYFKPSELKVIIIGQDPYPSIGDAHGLSFSVPTNRPIPKSLANIFMALQEQKLIDHSPRTGNLTNWARQGVLLLNMYLTRSPNIRATDSGAYVETGGSGDKNCLHPFWEKFTGGLIKYLTSRSDLEFKIFLWGRVAEECMGYIQNNPKVEVYTWGHPSPMNQNNNNRDNPAHFVHCNHFQKVAINWDPDAVTLRKTMVAFVDGSAKGNQFDDSVGGWGVHFAEVLSDYETIEGGVELSGPTPPWELELKGWDLVPTDRPRKRTNGRGELLASINAIIHFLKKGVEARLIIISDATYSENMINSTVWNGNAKENLDLVAIIKELLDRLLYFYIETISVRPQEMLLGSRPGVLSSWERLIATHTPAHTTWTGGDDLTSTEYQMWKGNDRADQLAKEAAK